MINYNDRIQFETGIIEYARKIFEGPFVFAFLKTASTELNKYISKHDCLPDSLLKFCNKTNQKVTKKFTLTIPKSTLKWLADPRCHPDFI